MKLLSLFGIALCVAFATSFKYSRRREFKCERITEPLCSDFPYNYTTFPNILGHDNPTDASEVLFEYKLLLDSHCSTQLRFFLCSLHFPMCTPKVAVAIPACRGMCEKVRRECEPIMELGGVTWPESIDCSKLPLRHQKDRLCMGPPGESPDNPTEADNPPTITLDEAGRGLGDLGDESDENDRAAMYWAQHMDLNPSYVGESRREMLIPRNGHDSANPGHDSAVPEEAPLPNEPIEPKFGFKPVQNVPERKQGKNQFVTLPQNPTTRPNRCKNPNKFHFFEKTKQCLPRCEKGVDVLFSSRHKEIAHWLLFGFSLLCFISTTVTVCTFMIDSKRFRYPERPIIFLSICYCAYSVAYLVRSANGPHHPIACVGGEVGRPHFAKGGFQGSGCTAVFFVLYYFGMAASAWWVVLSLTWLLSAGFKWGHEAIEAYGFYFHLAAWLIPAVQTISALVLGKVDGDELTGVCYIGNLDPESLMYFVIIPLTFYLLTGTVALVFGFGYLFKIRRVIRHQAGKAAGKLEKLMMRIGVFSVLYTVPAACVVAVNFYQYQNFAVWMAHAERIPCKGATVQFVYKPVFASDEYQNYGSWMPPRGEYKASLPPVAWRGPPQEQDYIDSGEQDFYAYETWPRKEDYDRLAKSQERRKRRSISAGNLPKPDTSKAKLDCSLSESIPSLPIFGIKIFMSLIAGITSGMWIWSGKTLESWRKFYESCRCDNPPKEEPQLVNKGIPDSRCDYDVIGIEGHNLYDTGKACHPNSLEWNQVIAVDAKRARMNEYVIMPGPRYPGEVPVSREGKPHVREYRGRLASSERFGWSGASDVRDFPLLNSDVISSDVACGDVRAERTSSGVPTLPVRVKSKKTKTRQTRNGVE